MPLGTVSSVKNHEACKEVKMAMMAMVAVLILGIAVGLSVVTGIRLWLYLISGRADIDDRLDYYCYYCKRR